MKTMYIVAIRKDLSHVTYKNETCLYNKQAMDECKRLVLELPEEERFVSAYYNENAKVAYEEAMKRAKRKLGIKVEPVKATAPATSQAVVRKDIVVYTDGACSGNPGPGGWAAILNLPETGYTREFSGNSDSTTNNRMELMAAIGGLSAIKNPANVTLYSDSTYLVNAFEKNWIEGWVTKGWLNSKKQPVENRDLWEQLIELTQKHTVKFVKVAGHAGDEINEKCDRLAKAACKEVK